MQRPRPYSRPAALAQMDGRSRKAQLLARVRRELTEHCGGQPSAVQRAIIERVAWLTLHVAQLDAKAAAGGGLTQHDSNSYLAWSNSLDRALRGLGRKGAAAPERSLADHLAARRS